LYKIADFGYSAELDGYHDGWKLGDDQRRAYRKVGHEKFRTPEQESGLWLQSDWRSSEICGNWSPQLNMWSLGALMWGVTTLQIFPPPVSPIFKSRFNRKYMSGLDPKLNIGFTYGEELESSDYSNELKILILWCMMEHPKHRPKPNQVVEIIQEHLGHSVRRVSNPTAAEAQADVTASGIA